MTRLTLTLRDARHLTGLVENLLGWIPQPTTGKPPHKVRVEAARRLQAEAGVDPRYTRTNLEAAIYYLQRRGKRVFKPAAIIFYVDKALEGYRPEPARPLAERIDAAVLAERALEHPGWDKWTSRLVRATGSFRADVLDEWELERGHLWGR